MAGNRIVGITIDVEGKSDKLVSSLKTANSAIDSTAKALKDVDKALKLDPQNVELLAQKEELLNKQIEQTNEKLEIMQQVADDANAALARGDISQEQYAQLTAEIVQTESALSNLENEADATNATLEAIDSGEMDELADEADGAADSMGDVATEADNAGSGLEGLGVAAAAAGAAMAAATAAMLEGLKEVGSALVDCTVSAGDYVDKLHTMESVTGISTETLQEMNYVSGLIDVSVETMTGSMTKLEKSMNSANEKNTEYYKTLDELDEQLKKGSITQDQYAEKVAAALEKSQSAYDQLGISVTDSSGKLRDNEDVFWEVIDALGQMEDGTERDLLAMELLGKSAKDLNPLIEAGSAGFQELAQEAHEVGAVMDDETLDAFQEFDDQMERLKKGGEAAKNALGTILLPSLNTLATTGTGALNKFTLAVQNSNGDIGKIGDAISEMLPEIFAEVNAVLPDILNLIGTAVDTLLQLIIDNLPLIIDSAMNIINMLTETLINPENVVKITNAALQIILTLCESVVNNLPTILEAAVQIILTLVQGLTNSLPTLIPAVVDAVLTIVNTLLAGDQLSQIINAGLQLIITLAGALIDYLPQLIDRLPELIEGIVGFLTGDALPDIIQAGVDLLVALVSDLPTIILAIIDALVKLIGDMVLWLTGDGAQELGQTFLDIFLDIADQAIGWGKDIIDCLVEGITSGASHLWDELTDLAQGIKDFLGFSVPEKGPLHEWAYKNPGADMVDLFAEGMDEALPELQSSIDLMTGTLAGGTAPNYSGQLSAINDSVLSLGGGQIVIPVYIGQERIDTIVAQANANNNFISGGR